MVHKIYGKYFYPSFEKFFFLTNLEHGFLIASQSNLQLKKNVVSHERARARASGPASLEMATK
jgi:hypothetical protein